MILTLHDSRNKNHVACNAILVAHETTRDW